MLARDLVHSVGTINIRCVASVLTDFGESSYIVYAIYVCCII